MRFLEIGVRKGGSLKMWRKYFALMQIIYGIYIDIDCQQYNGLAGQERIGSQTDKGFLNYVITEVVGVYIVLDDGSHHMDHILCTLKYLFPCLSYSGLYMIEDLNTVYWPKCGNGYHARKNFLYFVSDVINHIHHWYHNKSRYSLSIRTALLFIFTIQE